MADKTIGDLPVAPELYDDSLLVVEQQNEARSIKGGLVRQFAEAALSKFIQGAGYLLSIGKVTTGAAGSAAKVTNSGTAQKPVLDFTIPQGLKGDKGDPGGVTSIKGAAETSYRTGDVNLTPANIGAYTKAEVDARSGVTSVNGQTGAVTVTPANIGAYTKAEVDARSGVTSVNGQTGAVTITPANVGAVSKAGDTMTGDLIVANGAAGLYYVKDNGGRLVLTPPSGFGIRNWNIDGYEGVLRFFATRTDGTFFFPVYMSEAATSVNNTLVVGGKVELRTDGEGGNIRVTSPDASLYAEMDLYNNKIFRIYLQDSAGVHQQLGLAPDPANSYIHGTADKVAHPLTFTGAKSGSYDGSAAKTVDIPDTLTDLTDGTWKNGETVTMENITLSTHITSSNGLLQFCIPIGKPISAGSVKVTKLTGLLRGVSGYLDSNSAEVNLLSSAYTLEVGMVKPVGMVRIFVRKPSGWTNATNNTPVSFYGDVALTFAAASDEPLPGPEIFGDDAGMEGPSINGNVDTEFTTDETERAEEDIFMENTDETLPESEGDESI